MTLTPFYVCGKHKNTEKQPSARYFAVRFLKPVRKRVYFAQPTLCFTLNKVVKTILLLKPVTLRILAVLVTQLIATVAKLLLAAGGSPRACR